jgi:hypothetical protein
MAEQCGPKKFWSREDRDYQPFRRARWKINSLVEINYLLMAAMPVVVVYPGFGAALSRDFFAIVVLAALQL